MFTKSLSPNLAKLYAANFLTGLVFWYGIEKLFMQSIGIGPADIGWMLGLLTGITLLLDIPAGIIADRWSRKGVLVWAIVFLAASSIIAGTSHGAFQYMIGYIVYGFYLISASGTYHALMYDVAYEEGKADQYSKIMGRAYALFLSGAGVANIASGFLGNIDLRLPFWLTLIPCLINIAIILSIKEPSFHKQQQEGNLFRQLVKATRAIMGVAVLRSLVIMYSAFAVSEVFKQDYAQLYFMAFNNQAVLLGLFWAAYAFTWAFGNAIAHRFRHRLGLMLVIALATPVIMAVWHSPWALVVFMIQVIAAAAAHILIETRVQDATPSAVRASVLSVLGASERVIRLPASILVGWIIAQFDVFVSLGIVAMTTVLGLIYWLLVGTGRLKKVTSEPTPQKAYAQI